MLPSHNKEKINQFNPMQLLSQKSLNNDNAKIARSALFVM